jgi:hypothetical protein
VRNIAPRQEGDAQPFKVSADKSSVTYPALDNIGFNQRNLSTQDMIRMAEMVLSAVSADTFFTPLSHVEVNSLYNTIGNKIRESALSKTQFESRLLGNKGVKKDSGEWTHGTLGSQVIDCIADCIRQPLFSVTVQQRQHMGNLLLLVLNREWQLNSAENGSTAANQNSREGGDKRLLWNPEVLEIGRDEEDQNSAQGVRPREELREVEDNTHKVGESSSSVDPDNVVGPQLGRNLPLGQTDSFVLNQDNGTPTAQPFTDSKVFVKRLLSEINLGGSGHSGRSEEDGRLDALPSSNNQDRAFLVSTNTGSIFNPRIGSDDSMFGESNLSAAGNSSSSPQTHLRANAGISSDNHSEIQAAEGEDVSQSLATQLPVPQRTAPKLPESTVAIKDEKKN